MKIQSQFVNNNSLVHISVKSAFVSNTDTGRRSRAEGRFDAFYILFKRFFVLNKLFLPPFVLKSD